MKKRTLIIQLILVAFITTILANTSSAWPRRRPVVVRSPAVVIRPKTVVTPKPRVVTVSPQWGGEKISETELTPLEIKEAKIKPEYGLLDFEVYPYTTKIYIDGDYKGYASTLNKDKYSRKVRMGKHVIELKKNNAPIKVIKVEVKAGYKTTIEQS